MAFDHSPVGAAEGYASSEDLIKAINQQAKIAGYAVTIDRTHLHKDKTPRRLDLTCDRGGKDRTPRGHNERNTTSRKVGCPWAARAMNWRGNPLVFDATKWYFSVQRPHHNHEPSLDPIAHPAHRVLSDQHKQEIIELSRTTGISTRDLTNHMRQKYEGVLFGSKDIENLMLRARKEALGGYTPTQALLKLFDDEAICHRYRQTTDGRVAGVIWTYPWMQKMWRLHPHLISMDCTYKTNRFKMPFLNVTGVSNISSTFSIAFAILDCELEGVLT
jgi:hypothetical protein